MLNQQMQDPLLAGYFKTIIPTVVGMEMIIDALDRELPHPPGNHADIIIEHGNSHVKRNK